MDRPLGAPFRILDLPHELVLEIVSMLPIWVLVILTHCPDFQEIAYRFLRGRPRTLFGTWLLPPEETHSMMRKTRTVLTRSAALTIVAPSHWVPEDLDFCAPASEFDAVRDWFEFRGYEVTEDHPTESRVEELHRDDWELGPGEEDQYWDLPRVRYNCNSGIKRVVVMRKDGDEGEKKIKLIQSQSESPLVPVGFSDTTLGMNFVTGDGAICMYPALLQRSVGMLNYQLDPPLRDVRSETLASLVKYQDRGYEFTPGRSPSNLGYPGRRQWNDGHAVSMPFDSRYPLTVFPPVDWNTGHRIYRERGYYDVEPVVGVTQDAEMVYYENHLRKACMVLDVEDVDMDTEGSEVVEGYLGLGDEGVA